MYFILDSFLTDIFHFDINGKKKYLKLILF